MINFLYFSSATHEDILKEHARKVINSNKLGDRQRLIVRRKHIWSDVKRAMSQASFRHDVGLNITFVGESAVDFGGPLRELFRILWESLRSDNSLFIGKDTARIPNHNSVALQQKDFIIIGECIALALVYGGSVPQFLSQAVVSYLFDEPIGDDVVQDIPSADIHHKVTKVC